MNPVHNAQVCYFNNVWLMFLVFLKKNSFQTTVGLPPPRRFFIFFQLLLNTGFHWITLDQSDSAPAGAPSIHWMLELVVDEPEPPPCPTRPCWPTVIDRLIDRQTC